jgi:hypothetical protein
VEGGVLRLGWGGAGWVLQLGVAGDGAIRPCDAVGGLDPGFRTNLAARLQHERLHLGHGRQGQRRQAEQQSGGGAVDHRWGRLQGTNVLSLARKPPLRNPPTGEGRGEAAGDQKRLTGAPAGGSPRAEDQAGQGRRRSKGRIGNPPHVQTPGPHPARGPRHRRAAGPIR